MSKEKFKLKGIETRSIDYIPPSERYGHPFNQFTLWWGVELNVIYIGTGCFAPAMGLNMAWSLIAIITGLLIGGLLMAFHSAQGPHLGIPQMIQSRAQFGVKGAVIPLILAVILYIGFYSTTLHYAAQALEPINISRTPAIIIAAILTLIISIYGYDLIHKSNQLTSIVGTILFGGITFALTQMPLPAGSWDLGPVDLGTFFMVVSVYISVLTISAPYVADYSRYLPEDTSISAAFGYTYAGVVGGVTWITGIGAYLYLLMPEMMTANATVGVAQIWEANFPWVTLVYLILLFTAVCSCTISLYGIFMVVITTLSPFTKLRGTKKAKIIIMSIAVAFSSVLVILATADIIVLWGTYLAVILYFIIPWTAINLVDYYFVRKGNYSLKDIFDPDGIYGTYNKKSLITYFVTIIVQIPFMITPWFTGPFAKITGGMDLAWLVGSIVAGVMYYYFNRDIARTTNWGNMTEHAVFDEKDQEFLSEKLT